MSDWIVVRREHRRREHHPNVVSTLDLHGLNKEKAISTLTIFLSKVLTIAAKPNQHKATEAATATAARGLITQQQCYKNKKSAANDSTVMKCNSGIGHVDDNDDEGIWVHVITGTGKHSGVNGPVLRNSVKKVLDKRCMTYRLTNDKGGFVVRVDSGYELCNNNINSDTKIVVATQQQNDVKFAPTTNSTSSKDEQLLDTSVLFGCGINNPLPSQVHAEDEDIHRAKNLSSHEEQLHQNELFRKQIQQAVEESLLHSLLVDERSNDTKEDDEEIQLAIEESIQLHKNRCEELCKKEELELERALAASQLHQEEAEYYESSTRIDDDDDDDELQRALSLSLNVQNMSDQELVQIAITQSIQEF
jgi:hypothetical protein